MKVSIICTSFNKGPFLAKAIESFLAQETTFPFEILLIDDASTDNSWDLIQSYTKQYPDKIRAFANLTNLGIARTWKRICPEAKGDYIARCDGDDYWTVTDKLQQQVELLEANPDAKWSNTDFDMVDQEGNLLHANAFASQLIPLARSFEEMLALKAMTMASTWLVEADLMKAVTQDLDEDATDDTFNLQLDLFQQTKLVTLPNSTTAYRVVQGSDSKPEDDEKFRIRQERLLEAQRAYLKKYPQYNQSRLIDSLLHKDSHSDWLHVHKDREIRDLRAKNQALQEITTNQNIYIEELKAEKAKLMEDYRVLADDFQSVVTSKRWVLVTKIINFFRRNK